MYDRTGTHADLLGTTCMDINMVAGLDSLKILPGWRDMVSKMSDMTKKCQPIYLSPCHLQKLRKQNQYSETCPNDPGGNAGLPEETSCPCVKHDCKDDPDFIDEKGYFCDTW